MTHDPGAAPDISIIIVSYNVRDLLANCLHSLASALAGISHEVFVVDNNSDDDSCEMVRSGFPSVTLIANSDNRGFARANNQAIALARGRFILLLNPDTLVQEDTIAEMLGFFATHPDAGLAGCRIITPDGALEPACRRSFPSPWVSFTKLTGLSSLFPHSRLFARYNLTWRSVDETYEVDAVSGSFMMARREAVEAVGGLDERYFMYGEDLDWCYKMQQAGYRVYYVHTTTIIHFGGQSTKRSTIDADAIFYDAMRVFARKNLKLSSFSMGVISLGINLRLLVARLRRGSGTTIPMLLDALLVFCTVVLAEYLRFGSLHTLPTYAYPVIHLVPLLVVLPALAFSGVYSGRTHTMFRSLGGVALSFLVLSSLTYFFKPYAFSRAIVIISSLLNLVALPGWRLLASLLLPGRRRQLALGRPTLLVGINAHTTEVLTQLRDADDASYRVVGIVDVDHRRIGSMHAGIPIIGSVDYIARLIEQFHVRDVIFVPDVLRYADMLAIISHSTAPGVRYRVVPRIGDGATGPADTVPLTGPPFLEVDYAITRRANIVLKRLLDVIVAAPLLALCGIALLAPQPQGRRGFRWMVSRLPAVLRGTMSLVGHPEEVVSDATGIYIGKPGLTGLSRLRGVPDTDTEEVVRLSIQYARNYSIFLDIEILIRGILKRNTNQREMDDRRTHGEDHP